MSNKLRQQQRALARMDKRPAAGSLAQIVDDPVGIGPDRTITIDMAKLPPPSNAYDADFAWIEHKPGDVRLFFAKRNRDDPKRLRTRLELRYPPESLLGHFWRNSREFHERMKAFTQQWPQAGGERDKFQPEQMPADKEHSEWSNFEMMAHAGTEALIDFYTLPVSGIAMFVKGQGSSGLKMTPIVRVQLSVFELNRLLDSMEPIVDEIRRNLPEGFERTFAPQEKQS